MKLTAIIFTILAATPLFPQPPAKLMHPEGCEINNAFEQCFQAAGTAGLPYLIMHGLKEENVDSVYVNGKLWNPKDWSVFSQESEFTPEDLKKMPHQMAARKVLYVLILRKMTPTTDSIYIDVHYPGYKYFDQLLKQKRAGK